jgi:hypothetical protein
MKRYMTAPHNSIGCAKVARSIRNVRKSVLARAVGVSLVCLTMSCFRSDAGSDEIEYRGQRIKLSRSYSDYDDYKNDTANIHPSERARVQQLVKSAPVSRSYPNERALYHSLGALSFPGYGSGNLARTRQPDGTELIAHGIEIPGSEQERYLVFRSSGAAFSLEDDFLERIVIGRATVSDQGTEFVYRSGHGAILFRRPKRDSLGRGG